MRAVCADYPASLFRHPVLIERRRKQDCLCNHKQMVSGKPWQHCGLKQPDRCGDCRESGQYREQAADLAVREYGSSAEEGAAGADWEILKR